MSELCALHPTTGVGESGEYLDPSTDKQVGLGMLGLANLLRRYGVRYNEFGLALKDVNEEKVGFMKLIYLLTTYEWRLKQPAVAKSSWYGSSLCYCSYC